MIAFTFWEGEQFSYCHFLTIKSLLHFNPELRVIIYSTNLKPITSLKWNTKEQELILNNKYDQNELKLFKNVELVSVDLSKEMDYDCSELTAVWRSDIVRILKLYEHGGIYFDFDTLFINKIPEDLLNTNECHFNKYYGVLNNAFLVAPPKSPIIKIILDNIKLILHSNQINNNYMLFGSPLITRLLLKQNGTPNFDGIKFIPNKLNCPYLCDQIDKLFYSNIDLTTESTFAIHWYNGSNISRKFVNDFNKNKINDSCIFEKLVKKLNLV
jgi:hypothetical protein